MAFSGRSGDRLRRFLGAPLEDCFANVVNLFDAAGPPERVRVWRERARRLAGQGMLDGYDVFVFAGWRVATAMVPLGFPRASFLTWRPAVGRDGVYATVPHPSGLNRWWNDPENVERVRVFLQTLVDGDDTV